MIGHAALICQCWRRHLDTSRSPLHVACPTKVPNIVAPAPLACWAASIPATGVADEGPGEGVLAPGPHPQPGVPEPPACSGLPPQLASVAPSGLRALLRAVHHRLRTQLGSLGRGVRHAKQDGRWCWSGLGPTGIMLGSNTCACACHGFVAFQPRLSHG